MALTKVLTGGLALDAVDNTILKLDDDYALTGAISGAGKVGQVIQATKITNTTATSTSYVTTGLTASITPASTDSKVLIAVNFTSGYPANNIGTIYTLYRASTNIDASSARTGFAAVGVTAGTNFHIYQHRNVSFQFLDSPSTTDATAYALYFKADTGSQASYFNLNQNGDAAAKSTCSIQLIEIL